MAGILDSKTRIMDVVITEQGRRQLASGMMKVEYATFTDLGASYEGDINGVIEDPSGKIYFESSPDLPWDMVTFETDDSGYLLPFRGDDIAIGGTNLVISGSTVNITTSSADAISDSILDSWNKMQIIRSEEIYNDTEGFQLSFKTAEFTITDDFPFTVSDVKEAVIDDIESLDNDFRLSNLKNFKYLPPVNASGLAAGQPIGNFPDLNETLDTDTQRFSERLQQLEFIDTEFIETSIENNFVMQIFELSDDAGIVKLDVVDYGERKSLTEPGAMTRTLFAGKIIQDGFGQPTFVNIFTIELE
jgi:hypothetical protein